MITFITEFFHSLIIWLIAPSIDFAISDFTSEQKGRVFFIEFFFDVVLFFQAMSPKSDYLLSLSLHMYIIITDKVAIR